MKFIIAALISAVSASYSNSYNLGENDDFSYLLTEVMEEPPIAYENVQYGDVTVTISNSTSI